MRALEFRQQSCLLEIGCSHIWQLRVTGCHEEGVPATDGLPCISEGHAPGFARRQLDPEAAAGAAAILLPTVSTVWRRCRSRQARWRWGGRGFAYRASKLRGCDVWRRTRPSVCHVVVIPDSDFCESCSYDQMEKISGKDPFLGPGAEEIVHA